MIHRPALLLVVGFLLVGGDRLSASTAEYRLTFDASWSASTHPTDFPSSPHFSGLIGGTHNHDAGFWKAGEPATAGIRRMAEFGSKSPLDQEVEAAIAAGTAREVISGGGIGRSPGSVSLTFEADTNYPLVTVVSMIAPSPDWFVGVSGLDLTTDGVWQERLEIPLLPYDAGTDSGPSFASPNQVTRPAEPVSHITGFPFENASPLGTFTFELLGVSGVALQPGDADQDLDFDALDLVRVQTAAKYRTGAAATWGEGDWNGAPGGSAGSPPVGDGVFDQNDIVAALSSAVYLTGPYAAVAAHGIEGDVQTSIGYHVASGEVWIDAPAGAELTSVNIDSTAGIFTGAAAQNLGGSFDNDADNNIFKATFGGSFGSLSFGNIAPSGLSEEFLLGDLSVVGSLAGGGDLGDVDLVFVPEPGTLAALCLSTLAAFGLRFWNRLH